jgi:hypothetical protein
LTANTKLGFSFIPKLNLRNGIVHMQQYDVFLCHSSEDKKGVVSHLVESLKAAKISYWLDDEEILWGDSIIDRINKGLTNSRFVIVIITRSFLDKGWPIGELNSVLMQQLSTKTVRILPLITPDITAQDINANFSLISDKKFLTWGDDETTKHKIISDLLKILGRAAEINKHSQNQMSIPNKLNINQPEFDLPKLGEKTYNENIVSVIKSLFRYS